MFIFGKTILTLLCLWVLPCMFSYFNARNPIITTNKKPKLISIAAINGNFIFQSYRKPTVEDPITIPRFWIK